MGSSAEYRSECSVHCSNGRIGLNLPKLCTLSSSLCRGCQQAVVHGEVW